MASLVKTVLVAAVICLNTINACKQTESLTHMVELVKELKDLEVPTSATPTNFNINSAKVCQFLLLFFLNYYFYFIIYLLTLYKSWVLPGEYF